MPRALTIIASVAMKGCRRPLTMSAPLIAPSISAKHGVTSRTARTPNFVGTCELRNDRDGGADREPDQHGNAVAAPGVEHDLASPPRLDVAPARESVEDEAREETRRQAPTESVASGHAHDGGGRPPGSASAAWRR